MSKKIIIAIDGPAGSGKSTAAKNLARKLNFTYLDTGAMYRAITYFALKSGIVDDADAVVEMTKNLDLKLRYENGITRVFVNGEEITDKIRSAEVNSKVSEISAIPCVRKEMVKLQRSIGNDCNIIAEGRDIATVVFPDADVKIFLTASLDERANRRFKEYQENNVSITFEEVKNNLAKRDAIDSGRDIAPLKKADDAFEIDNTGLTPDDDLELLVKKIQEALEKKGIQLKSLLPS
ncbi:(d)CMP kinase [Melioribacter sp. OK-6-Me]|uniref:(d)CMP kinase n=1 Tax=unclassified Melioribacter TaxID=2627329 RepID=UPI003ED957AC